MKPSGSENTILDQKDIKKTLVKIFKNWYWIVIFMSLRISTKPKTLSEEEQDAELSEGRKATAEAEFVVLSENKKKVEAESIKIKEEIKKDKETLKSNKEEIFKLNDEILKVRNSLSVESKNFQDLQNKNNIKIKELEDNLKDRKIYKDTLDDEIFKAFKQHELDKFKKSQELLDMEKQKVSVLTEIKKVTVDWNDLISQKETEIKKVLNLQLENEKLAEEKQALEISLNSFNIQVENQKGVIKNNKVIMDSQDIAIKNKEAEIADLDKIIEKKKEEYKAVEKKAFSILEKEQILYQKEAFIKSQYERAGIKWDE